MAAGADLVVLSWRVICAYGKGHTMAIKTVQKKVDDVDGKELPDSTRPWRLKYQGKEFDMLTSPENRKKVEDFMAGVTKDALRVTGARSGAKTEASTRSNGRTAEEMLAIRTWLREQGHEVGSAGLLKKSLIAEYDAAHAEERTD